MAEAEVPQWDPETWAPEYLYVRLADHIAAQIAAGVRAPGSMFPNEREMVTEYHVSIDTIRKAMRILRERGLVVTLPSRGSYVKRAE